MKSIILAFTIILFCTFCSPQRRSETAFNIKGSNHKIHNEFKTYFDNCGVEGTIVIFDKNNQEWILSDTLTIMTESLPASTFKIINLLIALETKTIKNEKEIIKWVGETDTVKYGYRPEIYHDMSVKEAFEVSAGWVFIELAKKIGKEKYKKYLSACNYGNLNLTEKNDDFWNFGDFAISPVNQVEFIRDLYEEKLPFSKRNTEIVKSVMLAEQTANYTIRAKTGWTREKHTNTGWWVGYLEGNDNTYFFATRLLQDRNKNRDDFGSCRKEITRKIFHDLGFLKTNDESFMKSNPLFNSIDHIPVVVNDLGKVKDIFKNQLHFTIKEGKVLQDIKNCFVKFQDGTYLEFIEPTDSSGYIGKYYTNFLKTRQGGTSMAISIKNSILVKKMLTEKNIPFSADSNKIWQTIEPDNSGLFFIEYADKNWKDNPTFTTHPNTATSLTSTYLLTDNSGVETNKYKALGFSEMGSGMFLETPYKYFTTGDNGLYVLDVSKSKKISQLLNKNYLQGICGFKIKVNSLETFNKQTKQFANIKYDESSTTIYLTDYNLFLIFTQ